MLLFGKRHYCKGFQINHNCFPLQCLWVHISYLSFLVAVGEFCGGLGASPTCLSFRFVFFTLCALWDSHLLPDLHSRFPFFVAPLLFQLQDKNLRISKTRILEILESRIHSLVPQPLIFLRMRSRGHRLINWDAVEARRLGSWCSIYQFTVLSPGEQNSEISHHVQRYSFSFHVRNIRAF